MYKVHAMNSGPTTLAVSMTAAASGSSGITVADDDDIDFGTGNFTIHWEGALPDWTLTADNARMWLKRQDANNRIDAFISPSGLMTLSSTMASIAVFSEASASSVETILSPNQNAELTYVCTRETASADGSVAFYINGSLFDTQAIPAAATVSVSNSGQGNISCSGAAGAGRLESITRAFYLYNRALSAAEVLSLCNVGVGASDVGATQTPVYASNFSAGDDGFAGSNMTVAGNIDGIDGVDNVLRATCSSTGTARRISKTVSITAGLRYLIEITVNFPVANVSADSFLIWDQSGAPISSTSLSQTNVTKGAWQTFVFEFIADTSATGIRIYTGATASISATTTINDIMYISSFILKEIGCTLALAPTGLTASGLTWTDSSGNGNNGTLPAAGATKVTIRK